MQRTFKLIAIISYLFIIVKREMIGVPFVFWLLFTLFNFGNIDQLFAFLATIGLAIVLMNVNKGRAAWLLLWDVLCLVLLGLPIIARLIEVPIELFNYPAFIVPGLLFVVCYVISLGLSVRQIIRDRKRPMPAA